MDLAGLILGWAEEPWGWLLFGLVLLVLEIFIPGTFFLWLGAAAVVVGLIDLVVPMGWQVQVVTWGVLSLVLLLVGRRFYSSRDREVEDPFLNERAARYMGRVFTLTEPLRENQGTLKIDDTIWRISGPDLTAGTRVKVTGVDGPILKVEPA